MTARREEIIEVAKTIFAAQGVKQTSVRQIGATAGILSGSLYHHFKSKDALIDAILRKFCEQGLNGYREILDAAEDCWHTLHAMTRFAFRQVAETPAAIVILLNDSRYLIEQERFSYLVSYNQDIEDHWLQTLRQGIESGDVRPNLDVELVYRLVRGAIVSVVRWFNQDGDRGIDDIADEFFNLFAGGIVGNPGQVPKWAKGRSGSAVSRLPR